MELKSEGSHAYPQALIGVLHWVVHLGRMIISTVLLALSARSVNAFSTEF